ncbi:glycosyl transferase group 1 [Caldicellulosiruptor acetigenus I77R1B]|uniref:Glycosyl transferase group 1 n=1 Tax=Caldicellulosiruptor acetigenus (strain ATCC 700853 / DSM 12137 / I77R1B) TaxID=632335 RepID=E4S807_CALA7|nr:glycosyltransferase family 1 protein [Caldicellulosiruptor acetigenus]ADQ41907.1 glycosyl transferase group 1 [Caldicellulosiruptor acetigenus I77R1B]
MRIGVDARALSEVKTGIGYYLYTLVREIAKEDKKLEFFLFSNKEIFLDYSLPNVNVVVDKKSKFNQKGTIWFLTSANRLIKEYAIDIFWGPCNVLPFIYNKKVKKLLTIHDLVFLKFPQTMEKRNYYINKVLIPFSIKSADKIVTISKSTENDLKALFKHACNKVSVIYNPVNIEDIGAKEEEEYFLNKDFARKGYILYVGTIEPRKNIKILLDISEDIYIRTGLKVVLAGKMGWESEAVKQRVRDLSEKGFVKYLSYVNEKEKAILMRNCFVFVFPSFYEGFGLPVVEALKYGAVVLVSDASSLRELIDHQDLRFNPESSEQLKNKILQLFNEKNIYDFYRRMCNNMAEKFDNKKIIKQYLKLFYEMLGK